MTQLEGDAAEVVEIKADIEETRIEMGSTLNELGDRLEPGHLIGEAKENVREATIGRVEETARGMSDMVLETIKRNPIPAAMAGVGLAMLWKNRGEDGSAAGTSASGRRGTDVGSKVGDAASTVGDAASTAGDTVAGAVNRVASGAQEATGQVVDRAGATAQQVGWQLDGFMQANPIAMGAIAVGAGALIGSLLPETEQERQALGDASRQVSSTMADAVDQASSKAEEQFDRAEEKISSGS